MRRLILSVLLPLAACQPPSTPQNAANGVDAAPSPTPTPVTTPATDLTRYLGAYPLDVVGGSSFLADPAIRDAVAAAVPDAAVRARVLDRDVTATPVAMVDGRILSYGCEPHNCGPHNWSIAVTPDGKTAAVCYVDQDAGIARWYPEDAAPPPTGGCPSGDD
jgi:hypothetical protein